MLQEHIDYNDGYEAFELGEAYDPYASEDWSDGWLDAQSNNS